MSKAEESELLVECDRYSNRMLSWIVQLALHTGMRTGEIVTLRTSQVDLDRRVVRLTATKNGTSRTVPLTKGATEVLRAALANPLRPKTTDLVFLGEKGRSGKRGPYWFAKQWQIIKQMLGLHDMHFHDLRHEAVLRRRAELLFQAPELSSFRPALRRTGRAR